MNSEKRLRPNHEVIKIEEEIKKKIPDPLPGEEGHWRYNKDKKREGKPSEATTMESVDKGKKNYKADLFTKEEAKKMNREEQEELLKDRGVKFNSNDKEDNLIKKIVSSNPKK